MAYTSAHDFAWWSDPDYSDSGVLLDNEPELCSECRTEPVDMDVIYFMDGSGRVERPNGMCSACRKLYRTKQ